MFQFFPFSNAHQLNLDWILETISKLPWTVNNTYPDEFHNINLPTVAGMSSWNGIGADGAGNVDPAEDILDLDNAATGFHIYHWVDPTTGNIPTDPVWFPAGEGYCISCSNDAGYIMQLATGGGGTTLAIRDKNPGYPWTPWQYLNSQLDLSSNISLGPMVIDLDEPYNAAAFTANGWAYVYIEGKSYTAVGLNDIIANGLPTPSHYPLYFWGAVQDVNTTELKPCRFMIDSSGVLSFSYLGNCANTHDVISIVAVYPIA